MNITDYWTVLYYWYLRAWINHELFWIPRTLLMFPSFVQSPWLQAMTIQTGISLGMCPANERRRYWINFSEILIKIDSFSFKKMHLKMSSAKWRPFCLSLNMTKLHWLLHHHSQCPWLPISSTTSSHSSKPSPKCSSHGVIGSNIWTASYSE